MSYVHMTNPFDNILKLTHQRAVSDTTSATLRPSVHGSNIFLVIGETAVLLLSCIAVVRRIYGDVKVVQLCGMWLVQKEGSEQHDRSRLRVA